MPTTDRRQALSTDEACHRAGELAFSTLGHAARLGGVGLEQELFAIRVGADGRPAGRLLLDGARGVFATLDREASEDSPLQPRRLTSSGTWEYLLANGGRLTFEPGAQVEHSSIVHPSVRCALDDLHSAQGRLQETFRSNDARLAAAGLDVWHSLDGVPQQLEAGRYSAMAAYFDARGPWGRMMMRHSASLQINLDLGPEGVWQERWRLANLMAPLTLATFAASPGPEAASVRALAWQGLDPTRTGFPETLVAGTEKDPRLQWADAALAADVLLVKTADGITHQGQPGWTFQDWLDNGHTDLGWPTRQDLDTHLTTLFFEVRARGFLELRSCESLPTRWSAAPVVLTTAVLYDDLARERALTLLDGIEERLPDLWLRAARAGLHDPELGALAGRLWEIAFEGVDRMPRDYFGVPAVQTTREFLDRFTFAGLMPADSLAALAGDPRFSLAWATGDLAGSARPEAFPPAPVFSREVQPAETACAC